MNNKIKAIMNISNPFNFLSSSINLKYKVRIIVEAKIRKRRRRETLLVSKQSNEIAIRIDPVKSPKPRLAKFRKTFPGEYLE